MMDDSYDACYWRIDSQRKEIERLREEALARNATIGKLQADKIALTEMLKRCEEYIALDCETFNVDETFLTRLGAFIARMG